MRPRVFPAEDMACPGRPKPAHEGFNEAAGIPRGRPAADAIHTIGSSSFNEAAGIPRGRPGPNQTGKRGRRMLQ